MWASRGARGGERARETASCELFVAAIARADKHLRKSSQDPNACFRRSCETRPASRIVPVHCSIRGAATAMHAFPPSPALRRANFRRRRISATEADLIYAPADTG